MNILLLVLGFLSLAVVGALVGLTGLIPPLRRAGRARQVVSLVEGLIGALLAAAIVFEIASAFVVLVRVDATFFYRHVSRPGVYADTPGDSFTLTAEGRALYDATRTEMLIRQLNPLPVPDCATTAGACDLAGAIMGRGRRVDMTSLMLIVFPAMFISAVVAGGLIWHFTRPDKTSPAAR